MFKHEQGDWTRYRELGDVMEVDFHPSVDGEMMPYWERMDEAYSRSRDALERAYDKGCDYVLFRHGSSTSHGGKTTSRSQVRKLMRSPDATPFIIRADSIQHRSVFVAAIRPPKEEEE